MFPSRRQSRIWTAIDRLKSTAAQGAGTVIVEVANGYDVRAVMDDVKSRVDAIQNFAEEAEEPLIEELLLKAQILSVAVVCRDR